jgi:tetratricopeptide (TPR) repeat protein
MELEPDMIGARKQLSELYQQTGDLDAAWREAKQMVDSLISAEKQEEAIEVLNAFKEQEPVDNRRKLITVYKMAGDHDNAFAELYGLHEILVEQGQVDAAVTSLKEALELKPGDTLVTDRLDELQAQSAPSAPGPGAGPAPEPAEAGGGEEAPQAEKSLDDVLSEADVFMKYSLYGDARTLLEEMKNRHPGSVELHRKLKAVYREAEDSQLAVSECLELRDLLRSQGDEEAAQGEISEALEIDPSDARLAEYSGQAGPAREKGQDFSAELGEAGFYEQQGLLKEAADTYRKVLAISPGNEDVVAKLAAIEKDISGSGAPGQEAAPAAAPEVRPFMGEEAESSGLFDFSSILGDEDEGPAVDDMDEDVLGIFDEFKKGLAQEIADEDASTHYDLGIAYKEMGVVDDAIKEFQVASRDPKFFSQATTMIGICQMSAGRHDQAIEAFSAAIMKADPSNDTWWSLKYDLATAYEVSGKKTEAFEIYRDVYNWDVTFREVARKYETLKGSVGSEAPKTASSPDEKPPKTGGKKSRVSYI